MLCAPRFDIGDEDANDEQMLDIEKRKIQKAGRVQKLRARVLY